MERDLKILGRALNGLGAGTCVLAEEPPPAGTENVVDVKSITGALSVWSDGAKAVWIVRPDALK